MIKPGEFVIRRFLAPLWLRRNGVQEFLEEYERTQHWSAERIRELQWTRFRKMVRFAYENCEFYKRRFQSVGFHPEDLRTPADLKRLPVLTKDDIRTGFDSLKSQGSRPEDYIVNFTGGSTGSPLQFLVTHRRMASRKASTIRHDRWAGWDFGTWIGSVWGYPPDLPASAFSQRIFNYWIGRAVYLDTFNFREQDAERFLQWLIVRDHVVLVGYARSLLWFCRYAAARGITGLRVRSAITAAESITADERKLIEDVLQCETFERYGCREFSVLASECPAHEGLHLCAETLFVEFDQGGREAEPGQPGEILVTDLLNTAMPMIRYRIGDVGAPMAGTCSCGRGLPRMNVVAGRLTDFIHTPEGRWVSGVAINTYLVSKMPGARQVQIRQDRCDQLRILVIPEDGSRERVTSFLRVEIPRMFGSQMRYDIEWVISIPREASGKSRVTVSNCAVTHGFGFEGVDSGKPLQVHASGDK